MAWTLAPTIIVFRSEVNAEFPNRDKTSDGTLGNEEHSARLSDHNPDERGVVCAMDVDEDLKGKGESRYPHFFPGVNARVLRDALLSKARAGLLPQLRYIIYERVIYSATKRGEDGKFWGPNDYDGLNAHEHHLHISVFHAAALADSTKPWNLFTTDEEDDMPTANEVAKEVWDEPIDASGHDPKWYLDSIRDSVLLIGARTKEIVENQTEMRARLEAIEDKLAE